MLKTIKEFSRRRKTSNLKETPGERVRDLIIQAGIKTAEEAGYAAGNRTNQFVEIANKLGVYIDGGTQLAGGTESASALGRIVFKTAKDIARGDATCTGLCAVSATCETIALGCSTIKIIPYRGKVYVVAKIISQGCMSYRNLCAADG